jgi:hypothetical protein
VSSQSSSLTSRVLLSLWTLFRSLLLLLRRSVSPQSLTQPPLILRRALSHQSTTGKHEALSVPNLTPAPSVFTTTPSASEGAPCEGFGAAWQGDITWFTPSPGFCGYDNTSGDSIIAPPYESMGSVSITICGRWLSIFNAATNRIVQAAVGDRCVDCIERLIDISP